jgi:hypothetical protein
MAFSVLVEMLNLRLRRVTQPVKFHQPRDYSALVEETAPPKAR